MADGIDAVLYVKLDGTIVDHMLCVEDFGMTSWYLIDRDAATQAMKAVKSKATYQLIGGVVDSYAWEVIVIAASDSTAEWVIALLNRMLFVLHNFWCDETHLLYYPLSLLKYMLQ